MISSLLKVNLFSALLLTAAAPASFANGSYEVMMCSTYTSGGASVRGVTMKCEGEPDAGGFPKSWSRNSLQDLYVKGWRIESMTAYPALKEGEATVIFLLARNTESDPAIQK